MVWIVWRSVHFNTRGDQSWVLTLWDVDEGRKRVLLIAGVDLGRPEAGPVFGSPTETGQVADLHFDRLPGIAARLVRCLVSAYSATK